jgi:hypothetical protein
MTKMPRKKLQIETPLFMCCTGISWSLYSKTLLLRSGCLVPFSLIIFYGVGLEAWGFGMLKAAFGLGIICLTSRELNRIRLTCKAKIQGWNQKVGKIFSFKVKGSKVWGLERDSKKSSH